MSDPKLEQAVKQAAAEPQVIGQITLNVYNNGDVGLVLDGVVSYPSIAMGAFILNRRLNEEMDQAQAVSQRKHLTVAHDIPDDLKRPS